MRYRFNVPIIVILDHTRKCFLPKIFKNFQIRRDREKLKFTGTGILKILRGAQDFKFLIELSYNKTDKKKIFTFR